MGFYFRKSVKFGPIRFNFSKSGIGVSAGVKGARISTGPRGTYVHAGRNGFYYSQKIGDPSDPKADRAPEVHFRPTPNAFEIASADVSQFKDSNAAEVIDQINTNSSLFPFAPITGIAVSVVAILAGVLLFKGLNSAGIATQTAQISSFGTALVVLLAGSVLTWKVNQGDRIKRTTPLFYELDPASLLQFDQINHALITLAQSRRVWRVRTQQSTYDWKRNAGASSLISRTGVAVLQEQPKFVATNITVWCVRLNDQSLYFMPDYILVKQGREFGGISYHNFRIDFASTQFIEDDVLPSDARVAGYTWRFVNKKGGPDRRFSNNSQLPIAEYGFVHLTTSSGLNVHLHVSNLMIAQAFVDTLNRTFNRVAAHNQWGADQKFDGFHHRTNFADDWAYLILQVKRGATPEEVTMAYRQMAKMYHPDRLAHLAPEFIQIAEDRMKEINRAYEALKKKRE